MIKPNELRLGNYVKYPFHELQVCQLFVDSFQGMYVGGRGCYMYESCDGIPLTSEWLLKFGFEKKPKNTFKNIALPYYCLNGVCLFFNESPPDNTYLIGYGFNHGSDYYVATARWIDSVHELQNYYYALTGEELTIQE